MIRMNNTKKETSICHQDLIIKHKFPRFKNKHAGEAFPLPNSPKFRLRFAQLGNVHTGSDGFVSLAKSSVESQKGAIIIQRCSVENQKGAIVIDFVQ